MYVYQITCLLNGKSYIGITKNFERRMTQHKGGYDKSSLIDQMIQLEGQENFSYTVIDRVDSYEEAREKEKFYIKQKKILVFQMDIIRQMAAIVCLELVMECQNFQKMK